MPQMFIVSWPQSTSGNNANSVEPAKWHFVKEESDVMTLCDCLLPEPQSRSYAEIRTEEMADIRGFCFACFHNVCIIEQDENLWEIYNRVEELNSCFSEIEVAIKASKCSAEEVASALALFNQLASHKVIKYVTGE